MRNWFSKKTSKYTVKTSKFLLLCFFEKLGCQRKWIWKTFLIDIFDRVSDYESKILIRVKFKLNFANNFRFWINSFTTHQILKTICFFHKSDFEENLALVKLISELFTLNKRQNWHFCVFLYRMNLRKKLEWETVFESKNLIQVCLPTNFFTTCQFLNENFDNVSDVESTFLQRIRFSSRIVLL